MNVISRKAGEAEAWQWQSDGQGEFTVAPTEREGRGTTVTLHLKKGEDEFLDPARLERIIKTYSDHIAHPITLTGEGADGAAPVNTASALWTRPKKDITAEQYKEFYHHAGHAFDDPWLTIHSRAEGKIEYTLLVFVPSAVPFDLFDPMRKPRVKLYVKRVFITDDCEDLVPAYLRFVRGIVDSEDLSLNISREMLQNNPLVRTISKALVKRVLKELVKKGGQGARGIRRVLDELRRRAQGGHLRGYRSARDSPHARPIPDHTVGRRARLARRLCGPHEGGPGRDLHHQRR